MNGKPWWRRCPVYSLPLTVYGCTVTPLTNKIEVGEQAFVIGVGEGSDAATDLFAAPAGGGSFVRLTFNRAEERAPALSPDGLRVAFLRRSAGGPWTLVLLDLRNSGERTTPVPAEAGEPERLAWSANGERVLLRGRGYYESPAPPGKPLLQPARDAAQADSLTAVLLGDPPRGSIVPCDSGGLCIRSRTGEQTPLGAGVHGAIRWGSDSVGYFSNTRFEVRPLGGGRVRQPAWKEAPAGLRELTYHPGATSPP